MTDKTVCDERHERIEVRLHEVENSIKENNSLISAIKELAIETKYMREDMNETMERLSRLEKKDIEKWDKFKWLIIAAVVVLLVGYIATQLGLK